MRASRRALAGFFAALAAAGILLAPIREYVLPPGSLRFYRIPWAAESPAGDLAGGLLPDRLAALGLLVRPEGGDPLDLPPWAGFAALPLFFAGLWLAFFLLLGLRRPRVRAVRRRIAALQRELLRALPPGTGPGRETRRRRLLRRLERRREDLRREFSPRPSRRDGEIDRCFDGAWDALLTALGGRIENETVAEKTAPDEEAVEFLEAAEESDEEGGAGGPPPDPGAARVAIIDEDEINGRGVRQGEKKVGDQRKGEGVPEELEDPEELEELEELEEIEAEPATGPDPGSLASQIEFAPVEDEEDDPELETELEIVDPFADMISGLSEDGPPDPKKKTDPGENPGLGKKASPGGASGGAFFAIYPGGGMVELPGGVPPFPPARRRGNDVILERDGLHRINTRYFSPDRETLDSLDNEFRKVIDSVLRVPRPPAPRREAPRRDAPRP